MQVTDRADIDALLKNAVNIDAMNLYGSDAMAYGIMQQFARSNVSVTYTDEKGDESDKQARYQLFLPLFWWWFERAGPLVC